MEIENYETFGEKWKLEIAKLKKSLIIDMFSNKGKQCDKIKDCNELMIRALRVVKKNFDNNKDLHFVDEIIIDTAIKSYESLKP